MNDHANRSGPEVVSSVARASSVLTRYPAAVIGFFILAFMCCLALTASALFPGDPQAMVAPPLLFPGEDSDYWFGSDSLGRNVAAGIAHGARVSLGIGVVSATLSLVIGIAVGASAGFFGGWIDRLMVRITEVFQTIPAFLLVIVIVVIGRSSIYTIVFAIGLASWPIIARLVRAQFRSFREADFVMASRSLGCGNFYIIFHEILPNALPPVIVTTSVLIATAILIESGLSFLGLGDPNIVTWGSMIGEGREQLRTAWYLTAIPGTFIVLTVLALNLLGDGLNDALNPRLRTTHPITKSRQK